MKLVRDETITDFVMLTNVSRTIASEKVLAGVLPCQTNTHHLLGDEYAPEVLQGCGEKTCFVSGIESQIHRKSIDIMCV